jgi:hypothetical protein
MAWKRSPDHSVYPDGTSALLTRSSTMFDAVSSTDPLTIFDEFGPGTPRIIDGAVTTAGIEHDTDIEPYLVFGLRDVSRVIQTAFVKARLRAQLEERLSIAQHPMTAMSLGALAARHEDSLDVYIGDYPSGTPAVTLHRDGEYLTTNLGETNSDRRCPFAGDALNQPPSPVFVKFCQWSAAIAVMQDEPAYINRTA